MSDVTRILDAIQQGDPHAAGRLLPLVYDELRRLAAQKLAGEKPGQTLQPTALVHEVVLRLVGKDGQDQHWQGRGQLFAAAAEAMRRTLIENARRRKRRQRGGDRRRVDLHGLDLAVAEPQEEPLALDEALTTWLSSGPPSPALMR
jgi:RNA polymerase sigma factor (TIGR02999 family)